MKILSVLLGIAAWTSLLIICIVTIGPIWLRPMTSASSDTERFLAFLVLGAIFAAAYPERVLLIALLIVSLAGALEFGQTIVGGRHGHLSDFAVKAVGAIVGIAIGKLATMVVARLGGV